MSKLSKAGFNMIRLVCSTVEVLFYNPSDWLMSLFCLKHIYGYVLLKLSLVISQDFSLDKARFLE